MLDLKEGYNLKKKLHREKAWQTLEKDEPRLLVGTPRSKPFANLWRLFGMPWDPVERHKLLKDCEQNVRLCAVMYKNQMQQGRYFAHEHHYTTSNLKLQKIWKLMSETGVSSVEINQCETGAVPGRRSHFRRNCEKLDRDQIPGQRRR